MNPARFFPILLVVIFLAGCGTAQISQEPADSSAPAISPVSLPDSQPPESARFELRGSEVYENGSVLFQNVSNVKAVRLGPDGRTIHFQHITPRDRFTDYQPGCADLEKELSPLDPRYAAPLPPRTPPWDYERIATYATIEGCGDYGRSGGFLEHSDYFAYVEIAPDGDAWLRVEDIVSAAVLEFSLQKNIFTIESPQDHISWEATPIPGKNGNAFYYPQLDARLASGKLVVAFGTQLFAIDPVQKKFLGTERLAVPPYNVVADSFWFHSRTDSSFLVVESGWEGVRGFQAILDLSGDVLRVHRVNELPQPNLSGYKTPMIEWGADNIMLRLFKQIDLYDQLSKAEVDELENRGFQDSENMERREKEIAEKFMRSGKYVEVMCYHAGMGGGGCTALVPGEEYRLEIGGELQKI